MPPLNTAEEADATIVSIPPQIEVIKDMDGLQILSPEELPITIEVSTTAITINPAMIEIEAANVNITAEAAVEVEAGGDFNLTSGAAEIEAGDISASAGAVEFESGLFTVE